MPKINSRTDLFYAFGDGGEIFRWNTQFCGERDPENLHKLLQYIVHRNLLFLCIMWPNFLYLGDPAAYLTPPLSHIPTLKRGGKHCMLNTEHGEQGLDNLM